MGSYHAILSIHGMRYSVMRYSLVTFSCVYRYFLASVGQMVGSLLIAFLIAKVPTAHIAMTILSSVCGTLNVLVCLCLLTYE